jgi:hypothetical protein
MTKCDHITAAGWNKVRGPDGQERAFCKTCGKFIGYYRPVTPAKGK